MMTFNKIKLIPLILLLSFSVFVPHAFATHISKPIITQAKTDYHVGDTVQVKGWVEYNAQPAADVLLNFKVIDSSKNIIADEFLSSDAEGQFEFKLTTQNKAPGNYQITITSHCLEIHRYACTYKSETLSVHLRKP